MGGIVTRYVWSIDLLQKYEMASESMPYKEDEVIPRNEYFEPE